MRQRGNKALATHDGPKGKQRVAGVNNRIGQGKVKVLDRSHAVPYTARGGGLAGFIALKQLRRRQAADCAQTFSGLNLGLPTTGGAQVRGGKFQWQTLCWHRLTRAGAQLEF